MEHPCDVGMQTLIDAGLSERWLLFTLWTMSGGIFEIGMAGACDQCEESNHSSRSSATSMLAVAKQYFQG